MKKFKHRNTGDVAVRQEDGSYTLQSINLPSGYIEGSLDWEEIEEKQFEILSFSNESGDIFSKREGGLYGHKTWNCVEGFTEVYLLNSKYNVIHSVKRVSDGIVFTVGGTLVYKYKQGGEFRDTINSICLKDGAVLLHTGKSMVSTHNLLDPSITFEVPKEFLFTTLDGVSIYDGDSWWYVANDKMIARQTTTKTYLGTSKSEVSNFSSEAEAKKWILSKRKPNFITVDGVNIFPQDNYFAVNLEQNTFWEGICNNGTQKNKGVEYFKNPEKAKDFYIDNAKLSVREIGQVYSTATTKKLNGEWNVKAQELRDLMLKKLTVYKGI